MGEEKDSSGLIIGIIIGAIIALVLFGRNTQTVSAQPVQHIQQQTQHIQQQTLEYNWQPMDIPRVDDVIKKLELQKLKTLAQTDQITTSQSHNTSTQTDQTTASQPHNTSTLTQTIKTPAQTDQTIKPSPMSIYKNNEKWEIIRSTDGSIMSINIIRDVKKI